MAETPLKRSVASMLRLTESPEDKENFQSLQKQSFLIKTAASRLTKKTAEEAAICKQAEDGFMSKKFKYEVAKTKSDAKSMELDEIFTELETLKTKMNTEIDARLNPPEAAEPPVEQPPVEQPQVQQPAVQQPAV